MKRLWFIVVLFTSPAAAHAALYEFTVTARVFSVIYQNLPGPQVGDDVTIKYVADDRDIDPVVGLGIYSTTSTTVYFPGGMYVPAEDESSLAVILGSGTGGDDVAYGTFVRIPEYPLSRCPLVMTISFPRDFFDDESLPLSLPLSSARFTLLEVYPRLNTTNSIFSARVTSYSSVQVPEPGSVSLSTVLLLAAGRRRRHNGRP